MTSATRSIRRRCGRRLAGDRNVRWPKEWNRRCAGTSIIRIGGRTYSAPAAMVGSGLACNVKPREPRDSSMKGIVLSGGRGTRLYPATKAVSKQLIPLYDKPMIYYPLSTLMQMGIRDILVVTTPEDEERYRYLLGEGAQGGIQISYCRQPRPEGIAQALLLGRDFINGDPIALILGDNFMYGEGLSQSLTRARALAAGAINFAYRVSDPQRYGIVEFDADGRPRRLVEKPAKPKSSWAVIGLYVYDQRAPDFAAELKPSARGELEITDINQRYLDLGQLP